MFAHTPFQLQRTTWNESVRIRRSDKESWDIRAQNLKPFHNRLGRKRKVFPVCSEQFRTVKRMGETREKSHLCSVHGSGLDTTESSTCLQNQRDITQFAFCIYDPCLYRQLHIVSCCSKSCHRFTGWAWKFLSVRQIRNKHVLLKADLFNSVSLPGMLQTFYIIFSMYIKRTHTRTHFTEINVREFFFFFCLCDWVTQALMKAIKSEHRSVYLRTNSSHIRFSLLTLYTAILLFIGADTVVLKWKLWLCITFIVYFYGLIDKCLFFFSFMREIWPSQMGACPSEHWLGVDCQTQDQMHYCYCTLILKENSIPLKVNLKGRWRMSAWTGTDDIPKTGRISGLRRKNINCNICWVKTVYFQHSLGIPQMDQGTETSADLSRDWREQSGITST